MKTLMLAALLFLAASGPAAAQVPPPEPPDGQPEDMPAAVGTDPAEAVTEPSAETTATMETMEVAADGATAAVEPIEGAAAEAAPAVAPAVDGFAADAQDVMPAPGDSLMMDVGEVLDELLWPEPYIYQSGGTRDPFASLVGSGEPYEDGPVAIGDIIVVGVLWGEWDRFALIETRGGKSLVLRAGDAVQDGRVMAVLRDGLQISHTLYGITRVVTLPVRSGLEGKDER